MDFEGATGVLSMVKDIGAIEFILILLVAYVIYSNHTNTRAILQLSRREESAKPSDKSAQSEEARMINTMIDDMNQHPYTLNKLNETYTKTNTLIKHKLKETADILGAERICVYMFHNGEHSVNNIPFLKTTCICEYIDRHKGATSLLMTHKGVPINLASDLFKRINNHQITVLYPDDENVIDRVMANFFYRENDNITTIVVTIYDSSNQLDEKPVGFLSADFEFDHRLKSEELKDYFTELEELADYLSVSVLISYLFFQTKKEKE